MEIDDKELEDLKSSLIYYKDELQKVIEQRQAEREKKNIARDEYSTLLEENERLQEQLKQYENFNLRVEDLQKRIVRDTIKDDLLSKQIMESASKYNAIYPQQIPKLMNLKNFTYDSDSKQFKKPLTDNAGKIISYQSLDDSVKEFLNNPNNDNLILSKIKLDGMTKHRGSVGASSSKKKYDGDIEKQALERGLSVEDWIDIVDKRKSKIGR